jgi:hypothetical protein
MYLDHLIHMTRRRQAAPVTRMARLATGLAPAFFRRLPRGRCSPAIPSEDGGLDEVGEFCCRKRQLAFEIGNLPLGIGDPVFKLDHLLIAVDQFLAHSLQLTRQALVFTLPAIRLDRLLSQWLTMRCPQTYTLPGFQPISRSKHKISKDSCITTYAGTRTVTISSGLGKRFPAACHIP